MIWLYTFVKNFLGSLIFYIQKFGSINPAKALNTKADTSSSVLLWDQVGKLRTFWLAKVFFTWFNFSYLFLRCDETQHKGIEAWRFLFTNVTRWNTFSYNAVKNSASLQARACSKSIWRFSQLLIFCRSLAPTTHCT